jgi:hypothetical protein
MARAASNAGGTDSGAASTNSAVESADAAELDIDVLAAEARLGALSFVQAIAAAKTRRARTRERREAN